MIVLDPKKGVAIKFAADIFSSARSKYDLTLSITDGAKEVKWKARDFETFEITPFDGFFDSDTKLKMFINVEISNVITHIAEYPVKLSNRNVVKTKLTDTPPLVSKTDKEIVLPAVVDSVEESTKESLSIVDNTDKDKELADIEQNKRFNNFMTFIWRRAIQ